MIPKFNTRDDLASAALFPALGSHPRFLLHSLGPGLLLLALGSWPVSCPAAAEETHVLDETFDAAHPSGFMNALLAHDHVDLARGQGIGGSNAIRVRYQGNSQGSERVLVNYPLPPATGYSLSFAVRFCPGFDFGLGGKLHGLGPSRPVAGGNRVTPARWSARAMFRRQGGLQSYIYSQNKKSRYGDVAIAKDFRFQPDRYYLLVMQVQLNEPSSDDGFMRILVDGEPVIEHRNIQFRSVASRNAWISTLMFNTFHGGHSPEWAPRTAEGRYAKTCAYFDNFVVAPLSNQSE